MVIQEDLHLCYPRDYKPYEYDPDVPETRLHNDELDRDKITFKDWVRLGIVNAVWNEPQPPLRAIVGRIFSASKALRERAFYGLAMDECLPRKRNSRFALDIGCGAGWMLKRLSKVGWIAEGIEWDADAAALASERSGRPVFAGDFRSLDLPKAKYDLIFLSHVFEHLNDPLNSLKRFYELLTPEGRLVMLFPNGNSLDARWFGHFWFHWDAPRHLIFPTSNAIMSLYQKSGFCEIEIRTNVGKWIWKSSKAYKVGAHPSTLLPELDMLEILAFRYQQLMNLLGFRVGSEMAVILSKG